MEGRLIKHSRQERNEFHLSSEVREINNNNQGAREGYGDIQLTPSLGSKERVDASVPKATLSRYFNRAQKGYGLWLPNRHGREVHAKRGRKSISQTCSEKVEVGLQVISMKEQKDVRGSEIFIFGALLRPNRSQTQSMRISTTLDLALIDLANCPQRMKTALKLG